MNISSDKVHLADAQQTQFLDRNGIENILGPTLVDWHKQAPFQEIILLNGPGGFTNLRVGTLVLNLLNKLLGEQKCKIYTITKFELFSYLYKKWFLPQYSVVYIGQRDNVRLYDAEQKTYEQIKIDTIKKDNNLAFDCVYSDYWWDNASQMLHFHMTEKWLEIQRNKKSTIVNVTDLWLQAQSQVAPEYMIEAIN